MIFLRLYPRNVCIAYTQYGKSSVIAMALILRSQMESEPWKVVGGSMEKAEIIMEKVIQHLFDHEELVARLQLDPKESLDRLRRTRSKEKLTWYGGGGIEILSGDARNRTRVKEALTGEGGSNVVVEEASLLPDDVEAMIMRMVGGHTALGQGEFLLKIGNAIYRNHFHRSFTDPNWYTVLVDYRQGIAEGRVTPEFIDEMRGRPFFRELYECKFPEDWAILEGGYRRLVSEELLESRFVGGYSPGGLPDPPLPEPIGEPRLGVDVAREGSNYTSYVLRWDNLMRKLRKVHEPDLMATVGQVIRDIETFGLDPGRVSIDDNGVGGGVTDRLHEQNFMVQKVKHGSKAYDSKKFSNVKAEQFWLLYEWLRDGGVIERDNDFRELTVVNYKEDSSSRLKIEPKADLLKRGIPSPDTADAAAMTFNNTPVATAESFDII